MADEQALYEVQVLGVRQYEQQEALLMLEDTAGRELEIPVGLCEGLAIQLALAGTSVGRPLTHDLLLILAEELDAPVGRVLIDDYSQGTFYARLMLTTPEGEIALDCRPSDAIATALRAHAPIYATEAVMQHRSEE